MLNPELAALLRKRWYVVLLALGAIGYAVWFSLTTELETRDLLRRYGYVVILVWTFLEGETCVIIAGMLANTLGLNLWLIALSALAGSFTIDQIMFALGKYKGEAMLHYFPRLAKNVDRAAILFKKYDTALILGFRFIYGVRNVTAILLGISKVNHVKFFVLNLIGASVWALTFTFGGYYAGKGFLKIIDYAGYGLLSVILLVSAVIGLFWYRRSTKGAQEIASQSKNSEDL